MMSYFYEQHQQAWLKAKVTLANIIIQNGERR